MSDKAHSTGKGRFASPEESESTGKAESQDRAAIAQDLHRSRTDPFLYHEEAFHSVHRTSEEAVDAHVSSMAQALGEFDLAFGGRRSTSPGGESDFRGGGIIVYSANTTVPKVQTSTGSSPITPLNVKNRLLKPTGYFESLEKLESEVQSISLLNMLNETKELELDELEVPYELVIASLPLQSNSMKMISDVEVMRFIRRTSPPYPPVLKLADLQSDTDHCELLFHLIICRNIILSAAHKIQAMKTASYCDTRISILVLDHTRKNVARLVTIDCQKIKALARAFEKCLQRVIQDPEDGWKSKLVSKSEKVTLDCLSILAQLGLTASVEDLSNIWFSAVLVLDTGIISYVGAHVEHLDGSMDDVVVLPSMGTRPSRQFPRPSSQSHNTVFQNAQSQWIGAQTTSSQGVNSRWGSAPTRIVFEKRSFSCLDNFLRHKTAWVCRNRPIDVGKLVERVDRQPSLFLSTDAESFADIWGPMWSSHIKDHPDQVVHYNVGNGMILPWKEPENSETSKIQIRQSERFGDIREEKLCHWISDKDAREESNLLDATGMYLSPVDQLLIGASRSGKRLEVNHFCKTSPAGVKEFLRDFGALHRAGTIKKTRYKESETVQTQVGWSGVTMGIQANYKIRERTWKEVIIETWKNDPKRRVPRILEFWLGVEVSMCTRNARRRRLITLLGSDTMQTYLKSLSLEWTDPQCEIEFYAALSNPDYTAFRTLWNSHVDWRSDLGAAIGCCLDALATTGGVDGDLQALWVPEPASECIVTLSHHEHSWTRFLKDTRDSCTLAVFNVACLQHPGKPEENLASSCQSSRITSQSHLELLPLKSQSSLQDADPPEGKTLLQTSIVINKEYLPRGINRNTYHRHDGSAGTYKQCWNVQTLELKQDFGFGEKGILEVIHTLGSTQVLASWKSVSVHWMLKGKASSIHHHEFMGDEKLDTRPLDVVLQSNSKVQNYRLLAQTSPREGTDTPTAGPLASIWGAFGRRGNASLFLKRLLPQPKGQEIKL